MPPNSLAALKLLARQARDMTIASIPAEVAHQARLCLLDSVGCMLAGTRTQEARLVMDCEPALAAEAGATIVGTPHRRDWRGAVRVNGYLGDVLELNDLIGGHASIGVVSATIALAETLGSAGARTVEALVRGIEVTARVYDSVYPSLKRYTDMALVPVGIPSTIGAAAAAACLLELDEDGTHNAMAIAAALAGWCPAEVIFGDGGTVKPMLFGAQPADTGVTAAWYARAGMTGPPAILDGKTGYFATASLEGKFDAEDWQGRWALSEPRRKLHACCGYLHAPVDARSRPLAYLVWTPCANCSVGASRSRATVISRSGSRPMWPMSWPRTVHLNRQMTRGFICSSVWPWRSVGPMSSCRSTASSLSARYNARTCVRPWGESVFAPMHR